MYICTYIHIYTYIYDTIYIRYIYTYICIYYTYISYIYKINNITMTEGSYLNTFRKRKNYHMAILVDVETV